METRQSAGKTNYLNAENLPKIPLVLNDISSRFIREHLVVPLELKNNILKVLISDPEDKATLDALSIATSADIEIYTTDRKVLEDYIDRFYVQETQDINKIIEDISDENEFSLIREDEEDIGHLKDIASEAPIIKLVNMLITGAVESRASDIHIEPYEDELKVRYRIDGVLYDTESIPKKLEPAIISRIKIIARINIAERRLPQDGRVKLKVHEKEIDVRVSTIPVLHGESIVMRILYKEGIVINLETLGFSSEIYAEFDQLIKRPHGIILVTGPTGCGKTTTLYGALSKVNSTEVKIITVEDPIEYQLKGVNQIQVKPQIGLDFANTLRHIVRQDPDILMIGEIRDLQTAEIAIQSALTGHLVFSTLHTNDSPSAVTRLIDMGIENFLLSSTIRGILAQRLVRVICPHCKTADLTIARREEELRMLGIGEDLTLYIGKGCEKCAFTGYYGRTGLFELLAVRDEIRRLILGNADSNQIREKAISMGMKTLMEDGAEKIKAGITTLSEILRVTQEI